MKSQEEDKNNINGVENLGDRMKKYENHIDSKITIKPTESFVVRLDGRSFSKFTKKLVKPFDVIFIKAMGYTLIDLVEEFEAQTGYTHSDEITLIFNAKCTELEEFEYLEHKVKAEFESNSERRPKLTMLPNHMFNGRVQKIISLTSSFCSVRFNYHLEKLIQPVESNYDSNFVELIKSHKQMFDSRLIIFPESLKHEILNHQIWRSIHDCERNAISTYAYTYFGPKKIINKNCKEMIEMLYGDKQISWDSDIPLFIKHGIYCKKNIIEKEIDGKKVLRHEYVCKEFKISFNENNFNILFSKYWNSVSTSEEGTILENNLGNVLNLEILTL
jgi:tRNA(His) 5'-end guanylyltransferase